MLAIKNILDQTMCMVETPEAEDSTKIMEDHAIVGDSISSWTEKCKISLDDTIRVHGVKSKKNTERDKRYRK